MLKNDYFKIQNITVIRNCYGLMILSVCLLSEVATDIKFTLRVPIYIHRA